MENLKIKDTKRTKDFLSLINSDIATGYIDRELTAILKSIGGDELIKKATVYDFSENGLVWVTLSGDELYDYISTNNLGSVVGTNLYMSIRKSTIFPLHGDFVVNISIDLSCKLPEEDLEMFELMGKIHRNVTPAKVEKSVFCEV